MNVMEINVLVLAYLGDTVYENYVRRHLIESGIGNVNDLQSQNRYNLFYQKICIY